MFHVGQRVQVKSTKQEGIIAAIDPDMPFIYTVRLDNHQYLTFSVQNLEPVPNTQ